MKSNSDVTMEKMTKLADSIETYLEYFQDVYILPDYLIEMGDQVDYSIKKVKKLIKLLRRGDLSIFVDDSRWHDNE